METFRVSKGGKRMRAFVIKNEEGKYLTETFDWADDLCFAMTYDETHQLSNLNEYWQEITIAEGNLEKEIEEYHKWLDRYSVVPYQIMLLIEGLKVEKNNIRHQVCDEIRAFFDVNPDTVEWDYLNEILNQVEGDVK